MGQIPIERIQKTFYVWTCIVPPDSVPEMLHIPEVYYQAQTHHPSGTSHPNPYVIGGLEGEEYSPSSPRAEPLEGEEEDIFASPVGDPSPICVGDSSLAQVNVVEANPPGEVLVWERRDLQANRFRGVKADGPHWDSVVRRVTCDVDGTVIEDIQITSENRHKNIWHELLEPRLRDIETFFH